MTAPQPAKILIARVLQNAANHYTHTPTKKTATRRTMRLMATGGGRARYGYTPVVMSSLVEQSISL